ncbi:MAG: hypothetical protein M0Q22_09735 [Sulfuritalea sp.]|jgi:hypothetical protein|nr:hypothetical protein [Sulfuritalea sp.]
MLTLIVPGLIWTRQALADLTYDLPLPAFTTLLGKGRLRQCPPQDAAASLAEAFGLAAPLPAAALRRLALREHPGEADWLCLDPVRLRFEQRSVIVDDPQGLALTDEEAVALAVSLAPTFAGLGQLEVISPQCWNLRLAASAPTFQGLAEAVGRSASPLPLDAAYAAWRHAINEAQMQLHAHPVNQAREAAGQPQVNSLWPWGGGCLPRFGNRVGTHPHDMLWSADPLALGIARLLQIDFAALPDRFTRADARAPLALFDALESPARVGDALNWRDELARFEADWLAPALDALRRGRLDALRLLAPGDLGAAELHISRRDLWKFWRKPRALAELAPP